MNKQRIKALERKAAASGRTEILFFTETGASTGQYNGPDKKIYTRAEIAELEKNPANNVVVLNLHYEGDPVETR